MGEVYLKVVKVLVWFGPAEPSTAPNFSTFGIGGKASDTRVEEKSLIVHFGPSEGLPQQVSSTQTPQLRLAEIYS
jgi:hypothetical protein